MADQNALLSEIDEFLAGSGMSATYFGKKAVNNSELVARLRVGGDVRTATADRVREFIRKSSPSTSSPSVGAS